MQLFNVMAASSVGLALVMIVTFTMPLYENLAQPSTAPPSSLETRPLSPEGEAQSLPQNCESCWKPERRAGSNLRLHRRHRDLGLHPRKKSKGIHRSLNHALKSTLPRDPLLSGENDRSSAFMPEPLAEK